MTIAQESDLITIGVTCYNAQDTIERAVNSALCQDYPNFEIIVVDDASTDGSAEILRAMCEENSDVVRIFVHDVNKGASAARQTIINNASGEFIAFFDDDDVASSDRIRVQHECICAHEKEMGGTPLVACYASGERVYPNEYKMPLDAIGSQGKALVGESVAAYILFFQRDNESFYGAGTPTCSLMARKRTFENVGGFDHAFRRVEDLDFAIRLSLSGGHFIGTKQRLFTQYSTFSGDKAYAKNKDAEVQLAQKHKAYLQEVGRYRYALNWPKIRYYHFKRQYFRMLAVLLYLFLFYPVSVSRQFLLNAPKRLIHEIKMGRKEQT